MASKKQSIASLIRSNKGFADLAKTFATLTPNGRNALIQLSHHIRRVEIEIEIRIEEKYKKRLAALQKAASGDYDHD